MATTERDPVDVIRRILEEIPEGEHSQLRGELGSVLHDVPYAAPEAMGRIWLGIAAALTRNLHRDIESAPAWVQRISAIVQGREVTPIE